VALNVVARAKDAVDPQLYPTGTTIDPTSSAVSWSAIWAGTATAIGVSLTLLVIGSAFGLASVSPWPGLGVKPTTFTIGAGIWLIVMQWLSSALGGYIAGRLRTRWQSLHTDEVFFRDTAHGLLTWASATIIVAGIAVIATALSSVAVPPDPQITKEAAEAARKVATAFATFTAIAMVIGAFVASVCGAVGGALRDKHP
jgi:MFS family permease